MPSKYESQLKNKSGEFISYLGEKNILADIVPDSLREYSIKIDINDFGAISLYYSPNKNSYKIGSNEIHKDSLRNNLDELWNDFSGIKKSEIYTDKGIEIDVDGSYQNGITSFGSVIRKNGVVIKEISGIVETVDVDGSYQVAGEIKAVIESVKWCTEKLIYEVTIYHDYNGLEKWATGKWKTKKTVSKEYVNFIRAIKVNIIWVKIKSHTGVKWNEYADKLAKNAISSAHIFS
jgi:ribonuclease HI